MKKVVLPTLLFFSVLASVWYFSKSKTEAQALTPVQSPEEIVGTDFEKIEKQLKPENIKADEWKGINDYTVPVNELVSSDNAAQYFKTAQNNLPELYSCLKKDFCGMESSPGDPYFDDQRTPAHILMNRSLKIMKESLQKNKSLAADVNWDLIEELAQSDMEMLEVEALDIINQFGSAHVGTEDSLKKSQHFKGTAKADALVRLSQKGNEKDQALIASDIEEVFAHSDAHTVISVLETMGQMKLKKETVAKTFNNLCRFKEEDSNPANWKMISYLATKLNSDFKNSCN